MPQLQYSYEAIEHVHNIGHISAVNGSVICACHSFFFQGARNFEKKKKNLKQQQQQQQQQQEEEEEGKDGIRGRRGRQ